MDIKEMVVQALGEALDDQLTNQITLVVEKPKNPDFGDYAIPCFTWAKILKRSPQDIAQQLASTISHPLFSKVNAVGPYVNVFLDKTQISLEVLDRIISQKGNYGSNAEGGNRYVTIDLSGPNIAKPFSMGHLRSTVIGNAIANLAAKNGYTPIRINHLGDWGTQFGKLIVAYLKWGDENKVKQQPITELLRLYVKFHEEAEKHPELNDEGRLYFKKLEDGDPQTRELWNWFREESLKEFFRIYNLLDVSFDYLHGEAFYNDKMDEVIKMLSEKGLLEESEGALVVKLDEYELPPCLIQKSDGATIYATRDLATALFRKRNFDFAQSLYVVGNEQTLHFKQIKLVLNKAGFDWEKDMVHIPFGMMLQNGKKMSTRKGRVILLEEVLNEAVDLAYQIINEKNPTLENKHEVAQQVGIGAVIFQDLKNFRTNDVDFSFEQMLNFDGETGPYLQYTHARCHSLMRKAGNFLPQTGHSINEDEAWPIISHLSRFGEIIKQAWEDYDPSKIARYALDLARFFNGFYAKVRILDSENRDARLNLVYSVATVIEECLRVLGIKAPRSM
ncbi:arginine--tRNA ligase [Laceyella sacchari]|uniref:Arginine--tRNA ligase n=1 Tax=Laceyella tengchongensis TaxID=574699 RepID=A0AA46AFW1_9BACL|nr:arginine--tRNA ligase [Laceyella tengchongensis]AUS09960.1 arginine--tRNA ligase [Laceyella sacchari]SMP22566.1 arginyl-tRNA synthetase [Laceyella tengchongensis]